MFDGKVIRLVWPPLVGLNIVCYSEVPGYLSNNTPSTLNVEFLLSFENFNTTVSPISSSRLEVSIILSTKPGPGFRNPTLGLD